MMGKDGDKQQRLMCWDIEDLVPQDHLLRAIQKKVDFGFIYEKVKHLYSPLGRRSIDPALLIKMRLIGYLFGIPSERRLEAEVRVNIAYRWFLGLDLSDPVPDHSTFSQNRRRRFKGNGVFQSIFDHVVMLCVEQGIADGQVLVVDSTHIKANASMKKSYTVVVEKTPSEYLVELEKEAQRYESERKEQKKGPKKRGKPSQPGRPQKTEVRSSSDPDARIMARPGKPHGFHYLGHTSIDPKHGIITDIYVTPGNVNDQEPIVQRLEEQKRKFRLKIRELGADKGYDYAQVHQGLNRMDIQGYVTPFQRRSISGTKKVQDFQYGTERDEYECSQGKRLSFSHVTRRKEKLAKIYAAKVKDCKSCSERNQCLGPTARSRTIYRPMFQEAIEENRNRAKSPRYRQIQALRRTWCEGTFGTLKYAHNLSRTLKRGLENVQGHCLMAAMALNLKRMVGVLG